LLLLESCSTIPSKRFLTQTLIKRLVLAELKTTKLIGRKEAEKEMFRIDFSSKDKRKRVGRDRIGMMSRTTSYYYHGVHKEGN